MTLLPVSVELVELTSVLSLDRFNLFGEHNLP